VVDLMFGREVKVEANEVDGLVIILHGRKIRDATVLVQSERRSKTPVVKVAFDVAVVVDEGRCVCFGEAIAC
jgi:hypothetical protein